MNVRAFSAAVTVALLLTGCGNQTKIPDVREGGPSGPTSSGAQASPSADVSPSGPSSGSSETANPRTSLPVVVVLDASGSMKHDDAGSGLTRMTAAQAAVNGIFTALPADSQAAFVGYGTRMHGEEVTAEQGCEDVEVLSPLGAVDAAALKTKVDAVTAGGWTPIGPALREAAGQLGGKPGRIVLVSDGKNTCQAAPPCDVAKELKEQNPELTISVVSLRTDQEDVRCVAEATGGYYTTADTGKQLESRATAALDELKARRSLSPSGVEGITVGATHSAIRAAIPDFPALDATTTREWNGQTVTVVVWLDCEWLFKDDVLVAIGTGGDSQRQTIDGIGVGQQISAAEEFLGTPIVQLTEGNDHVRVYPASQTGLFWRVLTGADNVIRYIFLCRCGPSSDALVLSFDGLGPYKVTDKTLFASNELVQDPDGCMDWKTLPGYEGRGISLYQMGFKLEDPTATVAFEVFVHQPDDPTMQSPVVTYAGARVGMTLGEIKKLHPDLRIEHKLDNYGGSDLPVVRSGEREMIFFPDGYFGFDEDRTPRDDKIITHILLRDWSWDATGGC
ncbi:VWA domain-containing protein [Arachnia propionica]|uniref:VWA domain-containing protein n=1 Tax=Arachnia propionica TaxID=1750 RepID=A0A3P1WR55_9ACTN|nr:VWA domain-containing protein [Arachnia propionica]RRD48775.1 VWA domain-containing protein [Arachnia propionica]